MIDVRKVEEDRRREYDALPAAEKARIEAAKKSVGVVRTPTAFGTGFVAGKGLVVTNAHVIDGDLISTVRVLFVSVGDPNPKELPVKLLYQDRAQDLVVLEVDTADRPPMPLADGAAVTPGTMVAVIGNSAEFNLGAGVNTVSVGEYVETSLRPDRGRNFYRLTAYAEKGNSGGPVIDRQTGAVVGMQSFRTTDLPGRDNYGVPAPALAAALKAVGPAEKWPARAKPQAAVHAASAIAMEVKRFPTEARNAVTVWDLMYQSTSWEVVIDGDEVDGRKWVQDRCRELQKTVTRLQGISRGMQGNTEVPQALRTEGGNLYRDAESLILLAAGLNLNTYKPNKERLKEGADKLEKRLAAVYKLLDEQNGK